MVLAATAAEDNDALPSLRNRSAYEVRGVLSEHRDDSDSPTGGDQGRTVPPLHRKVFSFIHAHNLVSWVVGVDFTYSDSVFPAQQYHSVFICAPDGEAGAGYCCNGCAYWLRTASSWLR